MRFKASNLLRFLGALAASLLALGLIALRVTACAPTPKPPPATVPAPSAPFAPASPPSSPPPDAATTTTTTTVVTTMACGQGPAAAAQANATSLHTLAWAPFGRPELGWETYAPLVGQEIATPCAPDTPAFAAALAGWQGAHRLPADGVMTPAVFNSLKTVVQMRRPFVQVSARGVCPAPPAEASLATAAPAESYGGKTIQLRPGALAAYRRLAAAARAADPQIAADPRNLTIFSGYRSPDADAARCVKEGNCQGVVRASCSAHRTGLAMDLYVGQAPGFGPDSSADPNRLFMSRASAYRWLAANAARFGFVNYPFEPWHWEWTGEAP